MLYYNRCNQECICIMECVKVHCDLCEMHDFGLLFPFASHIYNIKLIAKVNCYLFTTHDSHFLYVSQTDVYNLQNTLSHAYNKINRLVSPKLFTLFIIYLKN